MPLLRVLADCSGLVVAAGTGNNPLETFTRRHRLLAQNHLFAHAVVRNTYHDFDRSRLTPNGTPVVRVLVGFQ
jgi:hypothetical protein